jgi:nitrogen regulatory protein P-II 1
MTKIEAIVRKSSMEEIREALVKIEVHEIMISKVLGRGQQKGHTQLVDEEQMSVKFLPKVKIEVVAEDDKVDEIVDVLTQEARTGRIGDGKIFLYPC